MSSEKPPTSHLSDGGEYRRAAILATIYLFIVAASFYIAYEIRFDFVVPEEHQVERLRLLPLVIGIKLLALVTCRQLGSLMTYFSVPDLIRLFWAMLVSSVILLVPRLLGWPTFAAPRGVLLTDFMLSFGGLCAGRLVTRLYRERISGSKRASENSSRQILRIAIIGAGDAGAYLAKEFISAPSRGFRPVMFLDDDVSKHGKLVHGVPVLGPPEAIAKVKGHETLAKAVIAMPSASAKRIREIVAVFTELGIKVETLPSLEELASGRVRVSRVRPVEVEDLLGRDVVDLDTKGIQGALESKVVMVTGAGGSIGSELCRQILALNPRRMLMLEQSEAALFLIEQELTDQGFSGTIVPLVASILDRPRMEYIFGRYHPQVIFHAAAHKHVFLMERQPAEAIRNNSFGTRQLAEMAATHGVEGFVFISTDKAINPTNVMGATKRLAELQIMAVAAAQAGANEIAENRRQRQDVGDMGSGKEAIQASESARCPKGILASPSDAAVNDLPSLVNLPSSAVSRPLTKFIAVRFGNVLGSSGSVVPIFKRQIASGGPVTVTHPEVTRYFMTIPEAVGLVLQSFVLGKGGEIFVLDMGQPVKIVNLAKQMIELSGFHVGEDIEIKFTGLKPGEKLFEELQHKTEQYFPTAHPRIMQFRGTSTYDPAVVVELERKLHSVDSNELKELLRKLVPEYSPHLE